MSLLAYHLFRLDAWQSFYQLMADYIEIWP